MKKNFIKQLFNFDLSNKVSIYVPSTTDVDKPTDNTEEVRKVIKKLSEWFGGATATKAMGGWLTTAGDVVLEDVTIVYAYCKDEQLQAHAKEVIELCQQLRDDMKQEAVSLEINGNLQFI